jgi:hypothetical protein
MLMRTNRLENRIYSNLSIIVNFMKYLLILLFSVSSLSSMAQSKKEQLELLTIKVDSLSSVIKELNNQLTEKSSTISMKEEKIDSLLKSNQELKNSIDQNNKLVKRLNEDIVSRENRISTLQNKLDSLTKVAQTDYLKTLPNGFKLFDYGDRQYPSCKNDFDDDGIEDLVILLSDENGNGFVTIYLSKNFIRDKSYQYFEGWIWTYNYLGDFSCNDKTFKISGGREGDDKTWGTTLTLSYDETLMKMVTNFLKDEYWEGDTDKSKISKKEVLQSGKLN